MSSHTMARCGIEHVHSGQALGSSRRPIPPERPANQQEIRPQNWTRCQLHPSVAGSGTLTRPQLSAPATRHRVLGPLAAA